MADEARDDTLEDFLNRATNPANRDEDVDDISKFCDQVNQELEGPQIAVKLLAHKIQSPQEREALYALATLEACMKHCGRRFHQEVGKFRFLNEIIKVISPKYLGSRTTDKVKTKCIELMYSWQKGLPHETKMLEAYTMLKNQGIIKEDPTYMDQKFDFPKPEERKATFEDEEKSKLLAKLLKSKNPDDLQAANRLIKNMVKQDTERMEKVSRRINELETIHTNVKLLKDMLEQYGTQTTESEKEMMKELYDSLEKLRPKLFRLASDTDENDSDGLNAILKANDEVSVIMMDYKRKVEGIVENGQGDKKGSSSLLDLNSESSRTSASPSVTNDNSTELATAFLDDELLTLGLKSSTSETTSNNITKDSLLSELDDIFSSTTEQPTQNAAPNVTNFAAQIAALQSSATGITQPMGQSVGYSQPMGQTLVSSVGINQPMGQPVISNTGFNHPANAMNSLGGQNAVSNVGLMQQPNLVHNSGFSQQLGQTGVSNTGLNQPLGQGPKQGVNYNPSVTNSVFDNTPKTAVAPPPPISQSQAKAMEDLDVLGQTLMQQTVSDLPKVSFQQSQAPAPKLPLNQLASKAPISSNPAPSVLQPSTVSTVTHPPPVSAVSGSTTTTVTTPTKAEIQPLTDVFVALDTIQPGTAPPVTAYDKNGLKILIHVAKNKPRDDVVVMVVSAMSTNTSLVKGLVFQAAVPKIMKVKLQPPSATDLPAYNPILPPAAITQVMLLANPNKEKIRLKYKLTYSMNDQNFSDVGDVEGFPVTS